jgi:putative ABC transport system ATP-binding protein
MVTHNMKDALALGNRMIMMHEGRIILDLNESQKAHMTVEDLLEQFEQASGRELANDRMLLTN